MKEAHILIVDDDVLTLRIMKFMLGKEYSTATAESGMQAIEEIKKNRPDLVLLDYQMPECDGRQTLAMIRREESMKNIPVIFLTGTEEAEKIEEIKDLHPAGYLMKPPVKEKLLAEIRRIL